MEKNKIAILTDSACNISENLKENVFVVPLYVVFEDHSKKDIEEISQEELYSMIDTQQPKTSAPSIDDFIKKITYIKSLGYEKIIGISLSTGLSGTYNSMKIALADSIIDYKIIDSHTVSVGAGILVKYAISLVNEGLSLEKINEKVLEKRDGIKFFAVISDLKYLIRGGRISHLKGLIGSVLKINPILSMNEEGKIFKYKSLRGVEKAFKYLINQIRNDLEKEDNYFMGLSFANNKSVANSIKKDLKSIISNSNLYLEFPLTSVLGAHAGPDTIVISYFKI